MNCTGVYFFVDCDDTEGTCAMTRLQRLRSIHLLIQLHCDPAPYQHAWWGLLDMEHPENCEVPDENA